MSSKRQSTSPDEDERPRKRKSKSANGKKLSGMSVELNNLYSGILKDQLREAVLHKKRFNYTFAASDTSVGDEPTDLDTAGTENWMTIFIFQTWSCHIYL